MELYCIKTHPNKIVIAGNIYNSIDYKLNKCCGFKTYNIGIKTSFKNTICAGCGKKGKSNGIYWIGSHRLIPIDSINIEEATECLNELILTK